MANSQTEKARTNKNWPNYLSTGNVTLLINYTSLHDLRKVLMKLKDFFTNRSGVGVLATASETGAVDVAVYSKPHFLDGETISFIMRDRLTHANVQSNPYASYIFIEAGSKSKGIRLYLQKVSETDDQELISSLSRRSLTPEEDEAKGPKFLVSFKLIKALPVLGGEEIVVEL